MMIESLILDSKIIKASDKIRIVAIMKEIV